jgi:porin
MSLALLPSGVLHADDTSDREVVNSPADLRLDWSAVRFGVFQDDAQGSKDASTTQTPAAASAPVEPETIWTRKQLTGDWWGARTAMADKGVTFDLRLTQFYQNVVTGGKQTGGAYGGVMDYILNVDGHKLGLWEDVYFSMHVTTQFGQSVLSQVGAFTFPNAQMLYPLPDYRGTAITAVQFMQFIGPQFALFGGKLNSLDFWDMIYPDRVAGAYKGFMNVNLLSSALPWFRWINLSELAGGFTTLNDKGQFQAGVVFLDTVNTSTTSALSDPFSNGVGILAYYKFFVEMDGKPGSILLAGGGSTGTYDSLDPSDWGFIPGVGLAGDPKTGAWSMGVYYDQVLWQDPGDSKRNVAMWVSGSVSDGDPSFGKFASFASVEATGVLFEREGDRAGFGVFYTELSTDFRDLVSIAGVETQNMWGVEAYYNYEFTPWFHLTGDVQVLQGAEQADDVAVVLGLRAVLDF